MKKMKKKPCKEEVTWDFIFAAREGNLKRARKLIKSFGLSYSEAWSEGYELLCAAVINEHAAVTKLLLTSGAKVNIKSEKPINTPLHFAVRNGDIEIVDILLDNGADVDAKNEISKTPLHVAAEEGHSQIAEHLLDNGAYVNCVCTWRADCNTPLHFAVDRGRTEVITLLLSRGANVDAKGKDNITPLHIAAQTGYADRYRRIAEDLLNHGASIHSSTLEEGYTPLHFASRLSYPEAVEFFLHRGADINARTKDNSTPLHVATKSECEKIIKLLLQHGAKVDNQDKDGKTILHLAVEKRNLAIVEDVLKYCPDINSQSNRSSLKTAVQGHGQDYKKIVEALLGYGLIINPEDANDCMLLHEAVEKNYLKIIEDLLKYGADVNALYELSCDLSFQAGFTPLHSAAKYEKGEIAKLLISYDADINAQDKKRKTPIFYAIERANSEITKLFLTNRADIKGSPELLNIAVERECIEIVEALLQYGADINASDESGRTALHFTAPSQRKGYYLVREENPDINIKRKIAKLLLSKGANVNARTEDGMTTLHAAAENGHVGVVEALLEYNANVNCKEKSDQTPLHFSARKGNKDISIMLLNKGANVNAKLKDGITPLHFAAQEGHEEAVEALLEHGGKADSKMKNHMTPLHLGAEKGFPKIIETILKFGADIDSKDEDGRTALHIASENGHGDVVSTLLEYGSDINITNKNDHTALGYAVDGIRSFYCQSDDSDSDDSYPHDNFSGGARFLNECPHQHVVEVIKRHVIKMKTANLYVSEENLLPISYMHGISDFQNECKVEIARMKNEKIINANFSFYDILAKDTSSLAMYMRNENIVQILESYDYKRAFPIYASMIENYSRKGMKKNVLLEQGHRSFNSLSEDLRKLPYDCAERIISYLSDEDLRNLIDACKPSNISNSNTNINTVAITPNITEV